jgi:hypothetical protein
MRRWNQQIADAELQGLPLGPGPGGLPLQVVIAAHQAQQHPDLARKRAFFFQHAGDFGEEGSEGPGDAQYQLSGTCSPLQGAVREKTDGPGGLFRRCPY